MEGTSQYRNNINDPAQHVFKAVRLSESDPGTVNVVTQMADAQYPNGYYPSCADLIEVTARLATPPATAPQLEPTDLYDPVNLCGPFKVRLFLDPRPQVSFNGNPEKVSVGANKYRTSVNLRLNTSPMMRNLDGATYTWEREIWRYDPNSSVQSPQYFQNLADKWRNINNDLVNPVTPTGMLRSGGTYSESGLGISDSIRFRCIVNFEGVLSSTNNILDRTCKEITTEPLYVVMPNPNKTALLATTSSNNSTTTSKISSTLSSGAQQSINALEASEPLHRPSNTLQSHTVDLLTAPNPAETQVGLRFHLPDDATVTVEVVDALQRVVLSPLTAEMRRGGEHELVIPVGSLPSGAYSVRVRAILTNGKTFVQQRALVIAR